MACADSWPGALPRVAEETLREWDPFKYPPEHHVGRRLRWKRLLFEFEHADHVTVRALANQSGRRDWLCAVRRNEHGGWDAVVRTINDVPSMAPCAAARTLLLDADFETACLYGIALSTYKWVGNESISVR